MKVVFDTSVLVAALLQAHRHHERARVWLQAVADERVEGVFTRHAVAETWSVLTRIPLQPALSGQEVIRVLERLRQRGFAVIDLPGDAYDTALRRCVEAGVVSGAVFDALHVVAAERAEADLILTFNVKDFVRLAVRESPPILAPPDPPSLELPGAES